MNWPRRVIRSPPFRRDVRSWLTPSAASSTRTSMCSPSSFRPWSHRAASSSGKRALKRRRTSPTVSPSWRGSSQNRWPVPSPPARRVTQAATSTVAVTVSDVTPSRPLPRSDLRAGRLGRASPGGGGALVEILHQVRQAQGLEQLLPRLARLAVVAHRLVPDVEHALPLVH